MNASAICKQCPTLKLGVMIKSVLISMGLASVSHGAITTNCYTSSMNNQATALNNIIHHNVPSYDCVKLLPGSNGNNTLAWFDWDNDISWKSSAYAMWQTAKWTAPEGTLTPAFLVGYNESLEPKKKFNLTLENLVMENVDLDTGSIAIKLSGTDTTWTLHGSRYSVADYPIIFESTAPLTISVPGGDSEIVSLSGNRGAVTRWEVHTASSLRLFNCGSLNDPTPSAALNFNSAGCSADIQGGTLLLDRSSVILNTESSELLIRDGGSLQLSGSDTTLKTVNVGLEEGSIALSNNTRLEGSALRMNSGSIDLSSGAKLSGFTLSPEGGTNSVSFSPLMVSGGVFDAKMNMSGNDTLMKVIGSNDPYAETGFYYNRGQLALGGGTLEVDKNASLWLQFDSPLVETNARPQGTLRIQSGAELVIDDTFTLDMSNGLQITNAGTLQVRGKLVAEGSVAGAGAVDVYGDLQFAPTADEVIVSAAELDFVSGSSLDLQVDPSGAASQLLTVQNQLDLQGRPELMLNLVNDTVLPVGTKIVLCDYDQFEGGHFKNYVDRHVFQLGQNQYRIKYEDPYYSSTNSSVITLTAGASDPPDAADFNIYVFSDTTNTVPALSFSTDPDDDPLTLVSVVASNGVATIDGTNVLYAPNPGFSGQDQIVYSVSDGSFTNQGSITASVKVYDPAEPEVCYDGRMTAQAVAYNNNWLQNVPPYNCLQLTPAGSNQLFWFADDEDIDWRDIFRLNRIWQTTKWIAPPGGPVEGRTLAKLLRYDDNLNETGTARLSIERLALENVLFDTGNIRLELQGYELEWTLNNSKYTVNSWPIRFDEDATLNLAAVGGDSEIVGLNGRQDAATSLSVAPGASLLLLGCGQLNYADPDNAMHFYQPENQADLNGGQLLLDQSAVVMNTGTNQFLIRDGGELALTGSGTSLACGTLAVSNGVIDLSNNTRLITDEILLNEALFTLASGARIADTIIRPQGGRSLINFAANMVSGGVLDASVQMSGASTVLRINGSNDPFAEQGFFYNKGPFILGQGTLELGNSATFVLRAGSTSNAAPQGGLTVLHGGELRVDQGYTLNLSDMTVFNEGSLEVDGTLLADGTVDSTHDDSYLTIKGSLGFSDGARELKLIKGVLDFDSGSALNMLLDPSGAAGQRIEVAQRLDLSGYPVLNLSLTNDVALPVGTKIVLVDYDVLSNGHFDNLPDGAVFTLGLNEYRIRYDDPYYSSTNSSVITLTAGANDPPSAGDFSIVVYEDTTNMISVLSYASDPDNDPLTLVSAQASNGDASIAGSNVVYAPVPGYVGPDAIDYCISDGSFTNCATIDVTVESRAFNSTGTCFRTPMFSQAISLNNVNHPQTPPYSCIELYPNGPNTLFWFDSEFSIDWRDTRGIYRMWRSAAWVAPPGGPVNGRTAASLVGYDGNLDPVIPFDLNVERLWLENVDLSTTSIGLGLRGFDLYWTLINSRLSVDEQQLTFDASAPLHILVTNGTSEIHGLSGDKDSVTSLDIVAGSTLIFDACGVQSGSNAVGKLHFLRDGNRVDVDGGTLRLNYSAVAFNTTGGAFTVANGGELVLAGTNTLLETTGLNIDGSVVSIEENAGAKVSGALSLVNGATLEFPVPAVDPVLPYGSKLLLFDYETLTGIFTNVPDNTIFSRGVNTFEIRYSDPDYDAGNPSVITLTVIEQIPLAPTALPAVDITNTQFVARWTDEPHASEYYLDVSESTNFTDFVGIYSNWNAGNATAALVSGLVDQTTYYYRVRAGNPNGTSPDSNIIAVPVSSNTPYVKYELTNEVVSAGSSGGVDLTQLFYGSGLTYSVVSNSNPALVTASISGTRLELTFTAGQTGTAQLTIRATDATGYFVDTVITINVVPEPGLAMGAIMLDPQDGLYEQVVTVTNNSATLAARSVTLTVTNLSAGASVYNATGQDRFGNPVIVWNGTLAPSGTQDFIVRYYTADRATVPSATVIASLSLQDIRAVISGRTFAINGMPQQIPGTQSLLIEFTAIPGKTYYVQYANALNGEWKTVYPGIVAPVNQIQWIDAGPPGTESPPLSVGSRFYRVIEITE